MSDTKGWVVTTSGDRPLGEVARELTACGFAVDEVLDQIGCVTGKASDDVARRLRKVSGVTDVSPQPAVDIGPPDAPVTW